MMLNTPCGDPSGGWHAVQEGVEETGGVKRGLRTGVRWSTSAAPGLNWVLVHTGIARRNWALNPRGEELFAGGLQPVSASCFESVLCV